MKKIYTLIVALLITTVNIYGQGNTPISFQEQVSQSSDSTITVDLAFDKTQFESPLQFVLTVANSNNEQLIGAFVRINEISGVDLVDGSLFSQDEQFYYFKLKSIKNNENYHLLFSTKLESGERQTLDTQKSWEVDND